MFFVPGELFNFHRLHSMVHLYCSIFRPVIHYQENKLCADTMVFLRSGLRRDSNVQYTLRTRNLRQGVHM